VVLWVEPAGVPERGNRILQSPRGGKDLAAMRRERGLEARAVL